MNKTRGEVSLTLSGKTHIMCPTWEALEGIENDLGCGLPIFVTRLRSGDARLRELSIVIYHGVMASRPDPKPTYEQVSAAVFEHGYLDEGLINSVIDFCLGAMNGGVVPKYAPAQAADNS